jgi:TPR repeat protein
VHFLLKALGWIFSLLAVVLAFFVLLMLPYNYMNSSASVLALLAFPGALLLAAVLNPLVLRRLPSRLMASLVCLGGIVLGLGLIIAGMSPNTVGQSDEQKGDLVFDSWGAWLGNAQAEYNVAIAYADGAGLPKDPAAAAKWMRRSADAGLAWAMHDLAVFYQQGMGVPKSMVDANIWYRKAADAGNGSAALLLALQQIKDGRFDDAALAVRWLKRASDLGSGDAKFFLGRAYYEGEGVPKNSSMAARLWKEASETAETNRAFAQINLAVLYLTGEGVAPNQAEAMRLLALAKSSGSPEAKEAAQYVENDAPELSADPSAGAELLLKMH